MTEGPDAMALLRSLYVPKKGIGHEVGMRDDIAYLKLFRTDAPDDFAVVNTPGDGWYELSVAGGFANTQFDEGASEAEAAEMLVPYIDAAVAYIEGKRTPIRTRILKAPAIRVDADRGPLELTLTVGDALRSALKSVFVRRRGR